MIHYTRSIRQFLDNGINVFPSLLNHLPGLKIRPVFSPVLHVSRALSRQGSTKTPVSSVLGLLVIIS